MGLLYFEPESKLTKAGYYLGIAGAVLSAWFWLGFVRANILYGRGTDSLAMFSIMVLLPAGLALAALFLRVALLMLVAFVIALPFGLYLSLTPLFTGYFVVLIFYLLSALFTAINAKRHQKL